MEIIIQLGLYIYIYMYNILKNENKNENTAGNNCKKRIRWILQSDGLETFQFSNCLTSKLDSQPPPYFFFFSLNAEENGNLETFLIMHVKNLPRSFSFYIPRFIVYNLPAPYKYLPQTCPIKFTQIPPYHLSTLTLIRFIYYYEEHGEDFNHFHSGGCAVGQWRPRRQATQPHGLRLGLCGRHR